MMATVASSTSTIYENISDTQSANHLEDLKLEDSGTYDADSRSNSNEKITSCSASPELSSSHQDDEKHIYTNIREMDELNNRPFPPVPDVTDVPRRNLNNGWMEYETEAGRTYFYNFETGKSQWIPPRFIRTPAQVQAILQATRTEVDENFSTTSSKHEDSHSTEDESSLDVSSSSRTAQSDEVVLTESTTSSEKKPVYEHTEHTEDFKNSPPVSTYHHAASSSDDTTMMSSFHAHVGPDPLGMSLKQNSTRNHVNQVPAAERSQSFNKRKCSLKNVPLPQVLPSTSSGNLFYGDSGTHSLDRVYPKPEKEPIIYDTPCDRRERLESSGSVEVRESVKTIKCGNLELVESAEQTKSRKRDWMVNFMYLTSAHLILYKDEKSAEKHGNHYAAPRGVCDLKGASVSWLVVEKEKRKRKIIQLELSNGCRYLFRSANDIETNEWFDALRDVIARLAVEGSPPLTLTLHMIQLIWVYLELLKIIDFRPSAPQCSGLPIQPAVLDSSCAIVRNPSTLSNRPHSTSMLNKSERCSRRIAHGSSIRSDQMAHSSIECGAATTTTTAGASNWVVDEPRPSRESILEKLIRFFRNRPSVDSLKEKGIYKHEPVFGSTLSAICQLENSFVPKFIRTVTELIESRGLEIDGLYRVSGNLSAVQRIRCQVDQDKYNALVNEEDVHVLTGALKLFFRELAEPVFPLSLTKDFLNAIKLQNPKQRFKRFDELLKMLPPENRETLKMLLRHLQRVAAHSDKNRMQTHNLAIMFGPTLFNSGDEKAPVKKKDANKKKKEQKKEEAPPVQSNSHLAFNMIMQGQIVEYLLTEQNKFEALQGPVQTHPH
ncbi:hypothetical protein Y032_0017g3193 [Ancylostoma ceylanicum]|uniref:RhoGAP domain protein n=2 Tax=Ancylostoma ceylanicum TaxID=53326 RepID=A0A016V623_9BILA|nr:hypothetical protein Y032_0017g3193 [Ancylostoma ceylanicum]